MATSPRANAPTATSGRGWTIVRPLGSRAVPTSLATGAPNEPLVVQSFRLDEGERAGDPVRDLKALANLRHTNVARIKEVTEKDSEVSVAYLFNDGETLAALRKQGPIPLAIELRILVDVLAGLTAIHGAKDAKLKPLGIVHGEVAPANVVIGTDGVPKVIQLAGVHAMPGVQGADTLGYVAPEILLADDSFDQRVDVYSVGVMLWEALTGSTLFPETNAGAIVTRHLSGRIRKPTLPADAPWAEGLVEVAQKAIATDPGGRYASANELASEIKRIAKTNVAPTMKVSALVKERGLEAINARRTALGLPVLPGAGIVPKQTAIAIKPPVAKPAATPEPPKPAALAPVPTPSDGAPTTKPVPSEDILPIDSADLTEDSAVKPAIRFVPPEPEDPSVHDRITSPSPPVETKSEQGQPGDFSDLAFDSEPAIPVAAPPGPPPKKVEKVEKADEAAFVPIVPPAAPIAKEPEVTPPPPAAFGPAPASPFASPSPVAPVESPFEAPLSTPPDDAQRKKRAIVFAVVGIGALILILGALRSCLKGKPETDAVATQPSTTAAPAKTTEPTATATATTEPTATAIASATATASATEAPTVAAKPEPTPTTTTTAAPTNTGVWIKPPATAAPTSTKPKKTYDPQGI